jgi:hypothetical protein
LPPCLVLVGYLFSSLQWDHTRVHLRAEGPTTTKSYRSNSMNGSYGCLVIWSCSRCVWNECRSNKRY